MTEQPPKTQEQKAQFRAAIEEITEKLGETSPKPRIQIGKIARTRGLEFAYEVLTEVLQVEASGGMMTEDGSRRRTPGGVYFYLARGKLSREEIKAIFRSRPKNRDPRQGPGPNSPGPKALRWQQRKEVLPGLLAEAGEGITARLTLQGMLGAANTAYRGLVILGFEHKAQIDMVPRGVPTPRGDTRYVVFTLAAHWPRVAAALEADENDRLVMEGLPFYDAEHGVVVLLVTQLSTRAILRGARSEASAMEIPTGDRRFVWEERAEDYAALMEKPGRILKAEGNVSTRLGKVCGDFWQLFVTTARHRLRQHQGTPPEMPLPAGLETAYTAYIGHKLWGRVRDAVEDDGRDLRVGGYVLADRTLETISIFATSIRALEPRDSAAGNGKGSAVDRLASLQDEADTIRARLDELLDAPGGQDELGPLMKQLNAVKTETKALLKAHPHLK